MGPVGATRATRAPKAPPTVHKGRLPGSVRILRSNETPRPAPDPMKTGIRLLVPKGVVTKLSLRLSQADNSPTEGAFGQWLMFEPDGDPEEPPTPKAETTPLTVGTEGEPPPAVSLDETSARETVPLRPGSYRIFFSLPLGDPPPGESVAPLVWSVPVKVRKEQVREVNVAIPTVTADQVARVTLLKAGPMTPFNQMAFEPIESGGAVTTRWEAFAPETGWPETTTATLLAGTYRVTMGASAQGRFSILTYTLPQPVKLSGVMEFPFQRPQFHTLNLFVRDRKGAPLPGASLTLHGDSGTFMFLESAMEPISVRVPEGRYTVRCMLFDREKQREVTLESGLDMSRDQERTWNAPTTALDFGLR